MHVCVLLFWVAGAWLNIGCFDCVRIKNGDVLVNTLEERVCLVLGRESRVYTPSVIVTECDV